MPASIEVYERDGSIITLCGVQSEKVTYKNVWIVPGESGGMDVYIGTIVRTFPEEEKLKDRTDGVLADVELDKGKIRKLSLKEDMIEGKVLSVKDDTIEIDGYGTLKLDDDFKVYKTYGVVKEQKKRDVLVGYDLGKFVVAGKKVCAALLNHDFSATNIRVLIMNDDYSSLFHTKVVLQSDSTMHVTWGESEETLSPGTKLSVSPGDDRLKEGRMTITLEDPQKEIRILSTKRAQGTPSYFGSFELSEESDGLLLINELDVEDYLTRVVPSEMPSNYELEALKAQAILARTFVLQFVSQKESMYDGADISTDIKEAQAYDATGVNARIREAVKETRGEVLNAGGELPYAWFHAHSGGLTARAKEGLDYEKAEPSYTQCVKGMENDEAPAEAAHWQADFSADEVMAAANASGAKVDALESIAVGRRGESGRAETLLISGQEVSAPAFRIAIGSTKMRSCLLESLRVEDGRVKMSGKGYGHGVGMSQWGAYAMAKAGKTAEEIVMHYFRGVSIDRAWE